jgi:hypothetical protein
MENTSERFPQNVCNMCAYELTAICNRNFMHTNNCFPLNNRNIHILRFVFHWTTERHKKFSTKQYKDTPTTQCFPLKKNYNKCQFLTQNCNKTPSNFIIVLLLKQNNSEHYVTHYFIVQIVKFTFKRAAPLKSDGETWSNTWDFCEHARQELNPPISLHLIYLRFPSFQNKILSRTVTITEMHGIFEIWGSYSGHSGCGFMGCEAMWSNRHVPTLCRNLLPSSTSTQQMVPLTCWY